jgi:hypothetical protein
MPIKRSLALLLAVLAAGCAELPSISPGPERDQLAGEAVQLTRLDQYFPPYNTGFEEQARLVVDSREAWEAAWVRVWKNHGEVPPAPAVDFSREIVLLAAMGVRYSGGHHVRMPAAAVQPNRVVVRVVETSPGSGCVTTAALTEPVDVVKLPRTPLPIEFQTVKTVHECL